MSRIAIVFDVLDLELDHLIRGIGRDSDLLLVSDVRSPRVEALQRDLNAALLVAAHRLVDSGRGLRHADVDLASQLAMSHLDQPLDAIVYANDVLHDLSWHEASLRIIPRGRVIRGLTANRRLILEDSSAFRTLGAPTIALCGDVATSDFVICPDGDPFPPQWVPIERSTYETSHLASASDVIDVRELSHGETVVRVAERCELQPGLVIALGSRRDQGLAIQDGLPDSISGRVIFATPDDPWATELLASHDAGEADAGVWSVAISQIPQVRPLPDHEVLSGGRFDVVASTLRGLMAAGSSDVLILTGEEPAVAEAFMECRALLADLGFVAEPHSATGDLDPGTVRADVVLVGPRARGAVLAAIGESPDFRTLMDRLTEPSLTTSAIVGFASGEVDEESAVDLRTVRSPYDLGQRLSPALLPNPNAQAQVPPRATEPLDPKRWVGGLRWGSRARLALPWRWGLLPRAMRGRW